MIMSFSVLIILNNVISQEYSSKLSSEERNQIIARTSELFFSSYVSADLGLKCAAYLNEQLQAGSYDDITHPRELVK